MDDPDPDRLFAALVAAHEGLDAGQSRRLDAQLILLLANHIGDPAVVLGLVTAARESVLPAQA